MTTTNSNEAPGSKAPSHIAYTVRDREGRKGFWTRIGSAWLMAMAVASTFNSKSYRSTGGLRSASPQKRRTNNSSRAGKEARPCN